MMRQVRSEVFGALKIIDGPSHKLRQPLPRDPYVPPSLVPVPAPDVASRWHLAAPWVESAIREGAIVSTSDDYKAKCLAEQAQLWLLAESGAIVGAGITEIVASPRGLTCAVPVLAAVSFDVLKTLFANLERWARAEGCVRLEGFGRAGWSRALKPYGWRPIATVIEKDI